MSDIDPTETEAETRSQRIMPELVKAGWGTVEGTRIREELICPGRIMSGGRRGASVSSDYVLMYRGQKLAAMEAKKATVGYTEGHAQAIDYASRLGTRFAYCTNGLKWREIDMQTGRERDLELPFPSPDELWARIYPENNDWRNRFGTVPFATDGGKWEPRYYQHRAISSVLEAIADGKDRILLTLATGTGKTGVAYQIAWKLFQTRWTLQGDMGRRPRILFLADRNILADQAYNSFSGFKEDARCRITPKEIKKRGGMPTNANIFFSIFHTFMTQGSEEFDEQEFEDDMVATEPNYLEYSRDFFDFIIIDECHRAGARDESPWRNILEYFEPAVQLGLTATPKRTANADSYKYFGEPVYTYSLREGIEDGFLTPFKVRQMASTIDEYVFRPGDTVVGGEIEEDRKYREADFNRKIEIEERERARVVEFMRQMNPRQKTLVFCATQNHAARVRDYINEIKVVADTKYCARVTADDGTRGEQDLRDFQDNEKTIPTILTTSRKLSTGVDARNVRNIILMRPVTSMIEFKQIVGRGTRTFDGKDFFTVYDFVKAYEHFNDAEWDGEPLEPVNKSDQAERPPKEGRDDDQDGIEAEPPPERIVVKLADGSARQIQFMGSTSYWFDGKPISAQEFLKRLFGDLDQLIDGEDELRAKWSDPDLRTALIEQLADRGYDEEKLDEMAILIDAKDCDVFDVLANVRFSLDPKTRRERADAARKHGLEGFEREMRDFLKDVLYAYERNGVGELSFDKLGDLLKVRYGAISDAKARLGAVSGIRNAFSELQRSIYSKLS